MENDLYYEPFVSELGTEHPIEYYTDIYCINCLKFFSNQIELYEHRDDCNEYTCPFSECKYTTSQDNSCNPPSINYINHLSTYHDDPLKIIRRPINCKYCKIILNTQQNRDIHENRYHIMPSKTLKCNEEQCLFELKTSSWSGMMDHFGEKHNELLFCNKNNCDFKYIFYEQYLNHLIDKHSNDSSINQNNCYVCLRCNVKKESYDSYDEHLKDISHVFNYCPFEYPFKCFKGCNAFFQTYNAYSEHITTSHSVLCDVCNKKFLDISLYNEHSKTCKKSILSNASNHE